VPTAKSAAPNQPTPRANLSVPSPRPSRLRRLSVAGFGLLASLAMVLPAQTLMASDVAASASPGCPGWASTSQPPDYIRVYRHKSGRVDKVPFKRYVLVVLGREWPGYLPQQVINAGAVAVKQYGWYHTLGNGRMTRNGQCFDVTDGTGDQLYTPNRTRIRQDHYTAINATWGIHLNKSGSLFMTGYRTGVPRPCGSDATGWKLYARSATRCAYRGDGFEQILRIYYGPVSVINSAGSGGGTATVAAQSETIPFTAPDSTTAGATETVNATAGTTGGVGDEPTGSAAPAETPIGERAFTVS
jgi:hypothetical protein